MTQPSSITEPIQESTNYQGVDAFTGLPSLLFATEAEALEQIVRIREKIKLLREGDKNNDNSNIIRTDNKN